MPKQEDGQSFLLNAAGFSDFDKTPLLDLNAQGVTDVEIANWRKATTRFSYGEDRLDFYTFPRNERVIKFFSGESEYALQRGESNPINNPLRLLRPSTLFSISDLFHYNGQNHSTPKYHAINREDRGWGDNEEEGKYIDIVRTFERVATTVLMSLNEADLTKRQALVKEELDKAFGAHQNTILYKDIRKASPVESPQGWLVYAVINILENSSEGITPIGRLRAIELLQLYPANELAEGFRSNKSKDQLYNGYDRIHTRRLPYTFCSREERLQPDHKEIWKNNQKIQQLLIRDSNKRIDWRTTATALAEKAPEEAIQVILLLLHSHETTEGALAFLRSIPQLDSKTKSRMFSKKATFLIEHKLAAGIDDAVFEGLGISDSAGSNLSEKTTNKSLDELIQMLRRKELLAIDLEESLVTAEARGAELAWENIRLKEELSYLRTGRVYTHQEIPKASIVEQLDPKGYYRNLGIHPQAFEGLKEEEIQDLVLRHYRFYANKFHPDKGGNLEQMKKINEAYEILKDANKRKGYTHNS